MPAPTMLYLLPENPTPAHRAQLLRSNKKLEQILGVTPSIQPIVRERERKSSRRRSTSGRERGRLTGLWGGVSRSGSLEEASRPLRTSTDSSASSAVSSIAEDDVPSPMTKKHRPPMLNLSHDDSTLEPVLDISPNHSKSSLSVAPRVHVQISPLSPTFTITLPKDKEEEDVLKDILNTPSHPSQKKTKMTRLAKRFGTQPPLELVYPPSPTSRSRHNPKRYTYGLPPPQSDLPADSDVENIMEEKKHGRSKTVTLTSGWIKDTETKDRILQVVWNEVSDESGREAVMNALRGLRS